MTSRYMRTARAAPIEMKLYDTQITLTVGKRWLQNDKLTDGEKKRAVKQALMIGARMLEIERLKEIGEDVMQQPIDEAKRELQKLKDGQTPVIVKIHRSESTDSLISTSESNKKGILIKHTDWLGCHYDVKKKRWFDIRDGSLRVYKPSATGKINPTGKMNYKKYTLTGLAESDFSWQENIPINRGMGKFEADYQYRIIIKVADHEKPFRLYSSSPQNDPQEIHAWYRAIKMSQHPHLEYWLTGYVNQLININMYKGWVAFKAYHEDIANITELMRRFVFRLLRTNLLGGWNTWKSLYAEKMLQKEVAVGNQKWGLQALANRTAQLTCMPTLEEWEILDNVISTIQNRFQKLSWSHVGIDNYALGKSMVSRTQQARIGYKMMVSVQSESRDNVFKLCCSEDVIDAYLGGAAFFQGKLMCYSEDNTDLAPSQVYSSDSLSVLNVALLNTRSSKAMHLEKAEFSTFVRVDNISGIILNSSPVDTPCAPGLLAPIHTEMEKLNSDEGGHFTILGPKLAWNKRVHTVKGELEGKSEVVGRDTFERVTSPNKALAKDLKWMKISVTCLESKVELYPRTEKKEKDDAEKNEKDDAEMSLVSDIPADQAGRSSSESSKSVETHVVVHFLGKRFESEAHPGDPNVGKYNSKPFVAAIPIGFEVPIDSWLAILQQKDFARTFRDKLNEKLQKIERRGESLPLVREHNQPQCTLSQNAGKIAGTIMFPNYLEEDYERMRGDKEDEDAEEKPTGTHTIYFRSINEKSFKRGFRSTLAAILGNAVQPSDVDVEIDEAEPGKGDMRVSFDLRATHLGPTFGSLKNHEDEVISIDIVRTTHYEVRKENDDSDKDRFRIDYNHPSNKPDPPSKSQVKEVILSARPKLGEICNIAMMPARNTVRQIFTPSNNKSRGEFAKGFMDVQVDCAYVNMGDNKTDPMYTLAQCISPEVWSVGPSCALHSSHKGTWYDRDGGYQLDNVRNMVQFDFRQLFFPQKDDSSTDTTERYFIEISCLGVRAVSQTLVRPKKSWLDSPLAMKDVITFNNNRVFLLLPPCFWDLDVRPPVTVAVYKGEGKIGQQMHYDKFIENLKASTGKNDNNISWKKVYAVDVILSGLVVDNIEKDIQLSLDRITTPSAQNKQMEITKKGSWHQNADVHAVLCTDITVRDRDCVKTAFGFTDHLGNAIQRNEVICIGDMATMLLEQPQSYPPDLKEYRRHFLPGTFNEEKRKSSIGGEFRMPLREPCLMHEYHNSGIHEGGHTFKQTFIPDYCHDVVPYKFVLPKSEAEFKAKRFPGTYWRIVDDACEEIGKRSTSTSKKSEGPYIVEELTHLVRPVAVMVVAMHDDRTVDLDISEFVEAWENESKPPENDLKQRRDVYYSLPGKPFMVPDGKNANGDEKCRYYLKGVPLNQIHSIQTAGFNIYDTNAVSPETSGYYSSDIKHSNKDADPERRGGYKFVAGPLPMDSNPSVCQYEWKIHCRATDIDMMCHFVATLRSVVRQDHFNQVEKRRDLMLRKTPLNKQRPRRLSDSSYLRTGGELEVVLVECRRLRAEKPQGLLATHATKIGKNLFYQTFFRPINAFAKFELFKTDKQTDRRSPVIYKGMKQQRSAFIPNTDNPKWDKLEELEKYGGHVFHTGQLDVSRGQRYEYSMEITLCDYGLVGNSFISSVVLPIITAHGDWHLMDPSAPFTNMWLPLMQGGEIHIMTRYIPNDKSNLSILYDGVAGYFQNVWANRSKPIRELVTGVLVNFGPYDPNLSVCRKTHLVAKSDTTPGATSDVAKTVDRISVFEKQTEEKYLNDRKQQLVDSEIYNRCVESRQRESFEEFLTTVHPSNKNKSFGDLVADYVGLHQDDKLEKIAQLFRDGIVPDLRSGTFRCPLCTHDSQLFTAIKTVKDHMWNVHQTTYDEWEKKSAPMPTGPLHPTKGDGIWMQITRAHTVRSQDKAKARKEYDTLVSVGEDSRSCVTMDQLLEDFGACISSSDGDAMNTNMKRVMKARHVAAALITFSQLPGGVKNERPVIYYSSKQCQPILYEEGLFVIAYHMLLPHPSDHRGPGYKLSTVEIDEDDVFWILVSLIAADTNGAFAPYFAPPKPLPRFYTDGYPANTNSHDNAPRSAIIGSKGVMDDIILLDCALAVDDKDLWLRFQALGFQLFTFFHKAFVCLFAGFMPTATLFRFWDYLFFSASKFAVPDLSRSAETTAVPNARHSLIDLSITVLRVNKEQLLRCKNAREIADSLAAIFHNLWDAGDLMHKMHHTEWQLWYHTDPLVKYSSIKETFQDRKERFAHYASRIGHKLDGKVWSLANQNQILARLLYDKNFELNDDSFGGAGKPVKFNFGALHHQFIPAFRQMFPPASRDAKERFSGMHRPMVQDAIPYGYLCNMDIKYHAGRYLNKGVTAMKHFVWSSPDNTNLRPHPEAISCPRFKTRDANFEADDVSRETFVRRVSRALPQWSEDVGILFDLFCEKDRTEGEPRLSTQELLASVIICTCATVSERALELFYLFSYKSNELMGDTHHIIPQVSSAKNVITMLEGANDDKQQTQNFHAPLPDVVEDDKYALRFVVKSDKGDFIAMGALNYLGGTFLTRSDQKPVKPIVTSFALWSEPIEKVTTYYVFGTTEKVIERQKRGELFAQIRWIVDPLKKDETRGNLEVTVHKLTLDIENQDEKLNPYIELQVSNSPHGDQKIVILKENIPKSLTISQIPGKKHVSEVLNDGSGRCAGLSDGSWYWGKSGKVTLAELRLKPQFVKTTPVDNMIDLRAVRLIVQMIVQRCLLPITLRQAILFADQTFSRNGACAGIIEAFLCPEDAATVQAKIAKHKDGKKSGNCCKALKNKVDVRWQLILLWELQVNSNKGDLDLWPDCEWSDEANAWTAKSVDAKPRKLSDLQITSKSASEQTMVIRYVCAGTGERKVLVCPVDADGVIGKPLGRESKAKGFLSLDPFKADPNSLMMQITKEEYLACFLKNSVLSESLREITSHMDKSEAPRQEIKLEVCLASAVGFDGVNDDFLNFIDSNQSVLLEVWDYDASMDSWNHDFMGECWLPRLNDFGPQEMTRTLDIVEMEESNTRPDFESLSAADITLRNKKREPPPEGGSRRGTIEISAKWTFPFECPSYRIEKDSAKIAAMTPDAKIEHERKLQTGRLYLEIRSAKGLTIFDKNRWLSKGAAGRMGKTALSDPFVKVFIRNDLTHEWYRGICSKRSHIPGRQETRHKTEVVKRNLNPVWKTSNTFHIDIVSAQFEATYGSDRVGFSVAGLFNKPKKPDVDLGETYYFGYLPKSTEQTSSSRCVSDLDMTVAPVNAAAERRFKDLNDHGVRVNLCDTITDFKLKVNTSKNALRDKRSGSHPPDIDSRHQVMVFVEPPKLEQLRENLKEKGLQGRGAAGAKDKMSGRSEGLQTLKFAYEKKYEQELQNVDNYHPLDDTLSFRHYEKKYHFGQSDETIPLLRIVEGTRAYQKKNRHYAKFVEERDQKRAGVKASMDGSLFAWVREHHEDGSMEWLPAYVRPVLKMKDKAGSSSVNKAAVVGSEEPSADSKQKYVVESWCYIPQTDEEKAKPKKVVNGDDVNLPSTTQDQTCLASKKHPFTRLEIIIKDSPNKDMKNKWDTKKKLAVEAQKAGRGDAPAKELLDYAVDCINTFGKGGADFGLAEDAFTLPLAKNFVKEVMNTGSSEPDAEIYNLLMSSTYQQPENSGSPKNRGT